MSDKNYWRSPEDSAQSFNILILDDQINDMTKRDNSVLSLIENMLHIYSHHCRTILLLAVQNLGPANAQGAALRRALKSFQVIAILPGLGVHEARQLAMSFLPYQHRYFLDALQHATEAPNGTLVVDTRANAPRLRSHFLRPGETIQRVYNPV